MVFKDWEQSERSWRERYPKCLQVLYVYNEHKPQLRFFRELYSTLIVSTFSSFRSRLWAEVSQSTGFSCTMLKIGGYIEETKRIDLLYLLLA